MDSSTIYLTDVKAAVGIWEREKKKNAGKTKHQVMWQCLKEIVLLCVCGAKMSKPTNIMTNVLQSFWVGGSKRGMINQ